MSTKPDDSAMPVVAYPMYGLTKREYFAAMALSGLISADMQVKPMSAKEAAERFAQGSVALADALIAALNKQGTP